MQLDTFVPNLVCFTLSNIQILGKTSDDINRKLGLVTKLVEKNKIGSKKFDDDVMSANCSVIVIFPIYGQFGAIWKLNS